jgi:DinB family protein
MRPVPEYDAKSWLMKALRETAHAMESLLWNIDDDLHEDPSADGEWSCAQLITHMAAMERRYVERLECMTLLDAPRIAAFDADSIDCGDAPSIYEAMDDFSELRRQTVYLLYSLDDGDWRRTGVHPYLGPLTIMQVAREMNEHDLAHLWQLRRLCDQLAPAPV